MAKEVNNIEDIKDSEVHETGVDSGQQFRQLVHRILPFWPIFVLAVLLGTAGGFVLLRYATPVYQVKARMIVNDNTQEKGANLQEFMGFDTRNSSAETEKEIEILHSTELLRKVAARLQLNVKYYQEGKVKTYEVYGSTPFTLLIQSPDSINKVGMREVKVVNGKIEFDGQIFPTDTFISSRFGYIKWQMNENYRDTTRSFKWYVSFITTSSCARQLKSAISVAPINKLSSIVDLRINDLFPARGVLTLNTLTSIYGSSTVDYKSRIYENSKRFLDERLNLIADELNGVEEKLQAYKTKEHITDLGIEGSLYLTKLKQADTKIGEINVQIDVLKEIEAYVTKRNSSQSQVPATLGITDPVLTALLNQLYQSEFELEKVKQLSGDKNPQVPVLEQIISKLKPSILASINNLKLSLEASRKSLQEDNQNLGDFINKIPLKERLLLDISRQQGIKNAIYTFLLQKREESAIAAASVLPNYRVIEVPELAGLVSPVRNNYYLGSIALALLLTAIFIFFKEFNNHTIIFRTQIENKSQIPIIGELMYKPNDNGYPVVAAAGMRSLIAEQFRELRTSLNYITVNSKDKCKVILVTSSIPSEGKSFVAINTSVSLSLTGARVVLMEFDLRKPKISKPLGISRETGITNYLIGNATESQIIQPHPTIPDFNVIASGPVPPNPAELISTQKLEELIDSLKHQFDYIVIDSPPIASVTDAKLLAKFADVTFYIVRHNFTPNIFLKLINDNFLKNTLPKMNIVFNGIKNKKVLGYGKGYGYGYAYNYGYGYTEENEVKKKWWRGNKKK